MRLLAKRLSTPNSVLLLLCLMYFTLYVDRVNISTAAPLIQSDLGLSNTELGLALSAFAYAYAPFQLIGGWFGHRFGARRTLCVALSIVCLATALTGAVGGLASLFAMRVALGFGEGAALPTATHAMSRWTPASRWGFAQGITHSFARLGNFITPAIVAALIAWGSWRASFVILAGVSLIWMAVWFWYFRDSPAEHPSITSSDLAALPRMNKEQAHPGAPAMPWLAIARRIAPATAVNFCYGWTLWLFLTWIPSFFVQNYQLALSSSALYASGVFLGGVVGDTLGGAASDRILQRTGNLVLARRSVIITGFLGAGLFLIPVILVHDLTIAAVCLSLAFFSAELIVAPIWAVPMDIAPNYAGSAGGMMNFGSAFAGIVSPFFFGYMVDVTGTWTVPFVASVLLLVLGAALTFALRPDRPLEHMTFEEPAVGVARRV
jgi:MFS family permease